MKNTSSIHFDGICIYLNSEIKAATIGKIILLLFNAAAWTGFIFMASYVPGEEIKSFILPMVLIPVILIFVAGRYTTWNLWGKEYIIINTKAITYSRSYGIIKTNDKVIKIENTLGIAYERIRFFGEKEYGELHFFDYDKNNNPKNIFETTILITKERAEEIIALIKELYRIEFYEKENIVPFTNN